MCEKFQDPTRSDTDADSPEVNAGYGTYAGMVLRGGSQQVFSTSRFDCIEGVAEVDIEGLRFRAAQQPLLQPWGSNVRVKVEALEDFNYLDRSMLPAPSTRWAGLTPIGWDVVAEGDRRACDPKDHLHGTIVVESLRTSRRIYYRGVKKGELWDIQNLAWISPLFVPDAVSDGSSC